MMTELEQLRAALQICQAQRNRAADDLLDVQVQAAAKIAELQAKLKEAEEPAEQADPA